MRSASSPAESRSIDVASTKDGRARRRSNRLAKPSLAESADPFVLYQKAVQDPPAKVRVLSEMYRVVFRAEPDRLREDFCGTAAVCAAWVLARANNQAWGVDLDSETLGWGQEKNVDVLPDDERGRVRLVRGDVRSVVVPPVDIICAQNFSYFVFQTREDLRVYFMRCREGLAQRGILVTDVFGGYWSLKDEKEFPSEYEGFRYVWEHHRYDPINARGIFKMHFRFPDGSELQDAFVYDWRVWTIPEIREVMFEAGFDRVDVYWEDTDPNTGEGTGTYSIQTSGDSDPAWYAYVIGVVDAV